MSGFAIVCTARKGTALGIRILGYTDRDKTKSTWWTSDSPDLLHKFPSMTAAKLTLRRLHHNRPRIVEFDEAYQQLMQQQSKMLTAELERLLPPGWNNNHEQ